MSESLTELSGNLIFVYSCGIVENLASCLILTLVECANGCVLRTGHVLTYWLTDLGIVNSTLVQPLPWTEWENLKYNPVIGE